MKSARFPTRQRDIFALACLVLLLGARPTLAGGHSRSILVIDPAYASAPGTYAAAPGYAAQPAYYAIVSKHHKQYALPVAASAAAPQPYPAGYSYAPPAGTYAQPVASYAPPAGAYAPMVPVAAAAAAPAYPASAWGTQAAAPQDDISTKADLVGFKQQGAVYDIFLDDLRKFYASNTESQGLAKITALKEEAKRAYGAYKDASSTDLSPEENGAIDRTVDLIVREDRTRSSKRLRKVAVDDEDEDPRRPKFYYNYAPAPVYYPPAPLYYIPAHGGHHK